MRKFLPILTLLLLASSLALAKKPAKASGVESPVADTTVYEANELSQDTTNVCVTPIFKDQLAVRSFSLWCQQRVEYPPKAAYYGLEGEVVCSLIVEIDGSLGEIGIVKSAHPLFNKEVLKVVKSYPKGHWKAATLNGKPVRFKMIVPVVFKMSKSIPTPQKTQTYR